MKRKKSIDTLAAQAGVGADKAFGAVSVPIYTTAIYRYVAFGKHRGFDYSRSENPTRQAAEKALAELEGGSRAVAFSSGMAAISAAMTLFRAGDHILCSDDLYGGSYRFFEKVLRPYGLSFDYVDMADPRAVARKIGKKTKAVFIETPTNPLMKIADIRGVSRIAKDRGVLSIVDNTFMSPVLQQPLALGTDIVVHSATKFLGGHNDLIGGAVIVTDPDLGEKMHFAQKAVGAVLSPFDSWLLLRGIKTLSVRVARAQQNAEAVAAFLDAHPFVKKVFYPGLPGHARRELHFSQASGPGAVISFELAKESAVPRFLESLSTVILAESLGGVETLVTHPTTMTHADIPLAEQAAVGLTPSLVRMSVGIENADDLVSDIARALRKAERESDRNKLATGIRAPRQRRAGSEEERPRTGAEAAEAARAARKGGPGASGRAR
ncbi:MAG: PLP-dependent transferase [Deltaproteobacteria bacterium]|nr:PLP-dependent transferase [Deltaproteobacteria bacterium]